MTKENESHVMSRLFLEIASSTSYVSVGDALEIRRKEHGLNRRNFSLLLGLQESHYSEVVNGKKRLSLNATKRAYAIGVPAAILLQQTEQSK